jgi:hypothetical protein
MPLAATVLHASNTNPSGFGYITPSVSPTANALQLMAVFQFDAGVLGSVFSVIGNGLTWEQIDTVTISSLGDPFARLTLFRALDASPSAGTCAIVTTSSETRVDVIWIEITGGVITTGSNGSGAIGVTAKNFNNSQANQGTVTYGAPFTAATSYAAAFFLINSGDGSGNSAAQNGFTQLSDPYGGVGTWSFAMGLLGPPSGLEARCSIPGQARYAGIAVEVLAEGAAGVGDGDDLFVLQVGGEQPAMSATPVVAY